MWLYLTKTVISKDVIEKLEIQKDIFISNPYRIISNRGTTFTSAEFEDYCQQENIEHIKVTVDLLRANGQVERINRTIIPVLAKMSVNELIKCVQTITSFEFHVSTHYQHHSLRANDRV